MQNNNSKYPSNSKRNVEFNKIVKEVFNNLDEEDKKDVEYVIDTIINNRNRPIENFGERSALELLVKLYCFVTYGKSVFEYIKE